MKIDFTTEEVTWAPSDSADPSVASPSIDAIRPMTSAMKGALMMPTMKVFTPMASCKSVAKATGLMPP